MEFQILFKKTLIVKHRYCSFLFFHSEAYEIVLAVCTVLSYSLFSHLPLVRSLRPFCQDQWMLFGVFFPPIFEINDHLEILKFSPCWISGYHFFGFCSGFHLFPLPAFFLRNFSLPFLNLFTEHGLYWPGLLSLFGAELCNQVLDLFIISKVDLLCVEFSFSFKILLLNFFFFCRFFMM